MRIIINDFGGYPFPMQLSKFLAGNEYEVVHTYVSNIKTPHGNMENDNTLLKLTITPIFLSGEFRKYSFLGRYKGEHEFAKKVSDIIDSFNPDIFISANTPLLAQSILLKKCKKSGVKFIYWCQDIHSIAIEGYLKKRLPIFNNIISSYFKRKEIKLLEQSDYVITIAESFNAIFKKWGVRQKNIGVIHNWGPISEIVPEPKINNWSVQIGCESQLVILYSGTLGLKHNPLLISDAAKELKENDNVLFIVISEGIGAEILQQQKTVFKLSNLLVLPYQEYKLLPQVLGSADILLSILENEAALFSVPSKVLTYLCAQKPIILSVPENNLSAQIISETNSGYCVEPNNTTGFINKIKELIANPRLRESMGQNGRKYAEENFIISSPGNKFIKLFNEIIH